MVRRWGILLATLALAMSAALAATSASAATAGSGSFRPGGPAQLVTGSKPGALALGISRQAESTNWSGYAATSGTYTSVSASWTQPAGSCKSGDQYSSFWVGLDGYNSNTVEQTGSDTDCSGKTPTYYAWYELYPNASVSYSSTVEPGDHLSASVRYTGSNKFSLSITDTTRGWNHTTAGTLAGAARSSAEVIVEAPCCTAGGAILPLTDFGTVSITGAQANGAAFASAGGMTEIAMVDTSGLDKVSVSSLASDGEDFATTWLRSS